MTVPLLTTSWDDGTPLHLPRRHSLPAIQFLNSTGPAE